ncbi:MAG: DUF4031 domain-containing protein [Chloroflexota bacterium]|jgi:hypothetical protein
MVEDESMILLDPLRSYPNCGLPIKNWCHMMTDDLTEAGLQELHAMAKAIGLHRKWFQDHPTLPHYDLIPCRRALALLLGAVEVNRMDLVRRCRRGKKNRASKAGHFGMRDS